MKRLILLISAITLLSNTWAQTYTVGVQSVTWTDAARSNRSVPVEFHYPGNNSAFASDSFPFVVFGHGFQMTIDAYYPFADSLAANGYIVALTSNEGSILPNHTNFAQDLIFIYNKMISESNTNSSSPLYHHVKVKGAIGGHSMGGGSTVLSCQYSDTATCYFTFAAATTNPSSITAAPFMRKPYLAFAGSRDCIAPIATNQRPMYDSSSSPCKILIDIKDATHCQFAASNVACNFGEGVSGCASTPLSRTNQISKTLSFLQPWLDYYLKGICSAWTQFESRYSADVVDTFTRNCTNTIPANPNVTGNTVFCNSTPTTLTANPAGFSYLWSNAATASSVQVATAGNYSFTVSNGVCSLVSPPVSVKQAFTPATPTAITGSDTVCSNISGIVISVINDSAATGYNWTLPAGWAINNGNNTSSITATSGTTGGTISVTAQNSCGISNSVQKNVVVVPSNLGTPVLVDGPAALCAGLQATYSTAPVSGAQSYAWTIPAGWAVLGAANTDTLQVTVGSTGGTVQVQPVNGCGQGLPATLAVTVGNAPLQGSITGLDTVCANGPGSLQFVLANASGADTIVWAVSNGWNIVSGQGTDTLLVSTGHSAGVVTVNTSNNCGASQPVSLNVAVLDTLPLAITQSNDTMYASTGGVTYHWFENGSPVAGATTPVLAGNHTGTFSVSVVNAAGCVSASQPYNFVFVSVNNILFESMVNIYPNPATGSFHVAVPASFVGGKIKIYDMQGKVVMLSAITNAQTDFAAQNFNKGIYLVEVEAGMGTLRKKLVLQ